jgi:hypothetical protein
MSGRRLFTSEYCTYALNWDCPPGRWAKTTIAQADIGYKFRDAEPYPVAGIKLPAAQVLGSLIRGVPEAPLPIDAPANHRTFREIVYDEEDEVGYLSLLLADSFPEFPISARQYVGLSKGLPPSHSANRLFFNDKKQILGAQGRNRTTDTVIFSHVTPPALFIGFWRGPLMA